MVSINFRIFFAKYYIMEQALNLSFPRPRIQMTDRQFHAKVFKYLRDKQAYKQTNYPMLDHVVWKQYLLRDNYMNQQFQMHYNKLVENNTPRNILNEFNRKISKIKKKESNWSKQQKQMLQDDIERAREKHHLQLSRNLKNIQQAILSKPERALLVPSSMLRLKLQSQNVRFHLGPRFGLKTQTEEFAQNRKRVRNTLSRCQTGEGTQLSRCQTGEGTSKKHARKRNQELNLPRNAPRNVSGKPQICSRRSSANKKSKPTNVRKLYHTIAETTNVGLKNTLQNLKASMHGKFNQPSYWHTDPMFQWPGVNKNTGKTALHTHENPKVEATFVLTAPFSVGQRYTNRLNRNGSGTGTTIVLPAFTFRVDCVNKEPNHRWTREYHISMLSAGEEDGGQVV